MKQNKQKPAQSEKSKKSKSIFKRFGFNRKKNEEDGDLLILDDTPTTSIIKTKQSDLSSLHSFCESDVMLGPGEEVDDFLLDPPTSAAMPTLKSLEAISCFMPNVDISQYPDTDLYATALTANRGRLKHLVATVGEDHPDVNIRKLQTAELCKGLGQLEEAVDLLSEVIESYKRSDNDAVLLSSAMNDLALVYSTLHQYEHAEDLFHKTVKILSQTVEADQAVVFGNIAITLRNSGNFSKAIPMHELAVKMMGTILGKDSAETLFQRGQLAVTLRRTGEASDLRRGEDLLAESMQQLRELGFAESHVWIKDLSQ
mmetsp:Transcript_36723/g.68319  ORF Transcript_36723/g.68319 Transcript_36723/m.68319 type:complete len:314 (+) Transcript_36723:94-1035(+)